MQIIVRFVFLPRTLKSEVTTSPYCLQVLVSSLESEAHHYKQLGIALRVPFDELEAIGTNVGAPTAHDKLAAMIQWWLLNPDDQQMRKNTWEFLLSAIKRCRDVEIVRKVEASEHYAAKQTS